MYLNVSHDLKNFHPSRLDNNNVEKVHIVQNLTDPPIYVTFTIRSLGYKRILIEVQNDHRFFIEATKSQPMNCCGFFSCFTTPLVQGAQFVVPLNRHQTDVIITGLLKGQPTNLPKKLFDSRTRKYSFANTNYCRYTKFRQISNSNPPIREEEEEQREREEESTSPLFDKSEISEGRFIAELKDLPSPPPDDDFPPPPPSFHSFLPVPE